MTKNNTQTNAKAVIMTVGLPGDQGPDMLDALKMDLDALQPETLALIATAQSRPTAQRMIERSGLAAERCEVVELRSAHDLDEVFRKTNALIERLVKHGYTPAQIAINYTSGTKVMGSGAVLSAVYHKIMELRYITGLASTRHRMLTTRPASVFAYQEMLTGRSMLLDLRFRSAHAVLESVKGDFLTPEDRRLCLDLSRLTRAYGEWDNFYPDRFLSLYRQVEFNHETLAPFQLQAAQEDALRQLTDDMRNELPRPHIITDLYNNAERRLILGRTEDALARLYRALEMLGQWVLARSYEIDTNQVDTRRIPPRDRVGFEALRSMDDGQVKIGLRKAYELLNIFNDPLGRKFMEEPVMRDFLEMRADSILAHGLRPAASDEGRQYMSHARQLFYIEIPDFDDMTGRLQFPWLNLHHPPIDETPET